MRYVPQHFRTNIVILLLKKSTPFFASQVLFFRHPNDLIVLELREANLCLRRLHARRKCRFLQHLYIVRVYMRDVIYIIIRYRAKIIS